ncbi:unnamed protein product [Durusdinium trenchii]|uniref:TM2 domain-containing protein n=1 Tax=Durusdinium trenchii TaxID=1381693 RepID=A0ABP0KT36_9DINO
MFTAVLLIAGSASGAQVHLSSTSQGGEPAYTNNPVCIKNKCVNPLTPGLYDLPRLSGLVWQCSQPGEVQKYLQFCKAAVDYDPAIPSPANSSVALDTITRAQDEAASTTFVYHLSGLGYEAWDFKEQERIDDEPCVSRIYELVCMTYFPRNQGSCKAGSQIPYLKPCRTSCEKYLDACNVECCDDSARCVFELSAEAGGEVSKVHGYADFEAPSAFCTGHSGSSRSGAPVTLLLALFGLQVGLGLDNTENNGSRSRSRGLVEFGLLMSLLVCAASLQGCSLEIPTHDRANWSRQPNYLIKYEHVGPGQPSSAAILNSCSVGASTRQVCSGHGQCVPWMKTPLSLAKPGDAVANMGVAFCECDSGWADPECRTVRKSQLKAFFLSLFGGFLGLDLFYMGFWLRGTLKLLTLGGFGLWWAFDIVRVGAAPTYAKQFKLNNDLPHWVFMLINVLLFGGGGLAYSMSSYARFNKMKMREGEKTHGSDEIIMDRSEGGQGIRFDKSAVAQEGEEGVCFEGLADDWVQQSQKICRPNQVNYDTPRETLMIVMQRDGNQLGFTAPAMRADEEVVRAAVRQDGHALQFACQELRNNADIVLEAVRQDGHALVYASPALKARKELVLEAVHQDGHSMVFADVALREDRDVVLEAVQQDGYALSYASAALRADREVVLEAVRSTGYALLFADEKFRADKEVMFEAVQSNWQALGYASPELRNDRDVVKAAVATNRQALAMVSEELRKDPAIVQEALQADGHALVYLNQTQQADKAIVAAAIKQDGHAISYASQEIRRDLDIAMQAVSEDGITLGLLPQEVQANKSVALRAIESNVKAFQNVSEELKRDEDVQEAMLASERYALLHSVKVDGYALRTASKRMQADREIVLAAVKQNGKVLVFAPEELRKDREVVLAAVRQNGKALVFAHETLKNDKEVVMEAVAEGGHIALWHASEELQKDKEILLAVK